jgi:Resolvase, N terminal domain
LVVTKLDRLARSLPDIRDILDELTRRNVKLSLGGSIQGRNPNPRPGIPKLYDQDLVNMHKELSGD